MRINKKNGWTVKKLSSALCAEFKNKKYGCDCRNHRPATGWTFGINAITLAVKMAKLCWQPYWEGTLPTPSTQYPEDYVVYAKKIGAII